MSQYQSLVAALKSLTQGEAPATVTLPMAENGWNTRPDTESYGIVSLDFEADAFWADDRKKDIVYEGSADLFSKSKNGAGWVQLITETLTAYCDGCWSLNSHTYERDTGLFHWEWTFEVTD
jgi:hypothetical protein